MCVASQSETARICISLALVGGAEWIGLFLLALFEFIDAVIAGAVQCFRHPMFHMMFRHGLRKIVTYMEAV